MNNKEHWIVDTKGKPCSSYFEISVIRKSNEHGFKSYGWFNPDNKRLISHNGGPCKDPIDDQFTWDLLIELAQRVADNLNEIDYMVTINKEMKSWITAAKCENCTHWGSEYNAPPELNKRICHGPTYTIGVPANDLTPHDYFCPAWKKEKMILPRCPECDKPYFQDNTAYQFVIKQACDCEL